MSEYDKHSALLAVPHQQCSRETLAARYEYLGNLLTSAGYSGQLLRRYADEGALICTGTIAVPIFPSDVVLRCRKNDDDNDDNDDYFVSSF